jgi:hypothetical protein
MIDIVNLHFKIEIQISTLNLHYNLKLKIQLDIYSSTDNKHHSM